MIASLVLVAAQSPAHFLWAQFRAGEHRSVVLSFAERPGDSVLGIMGEMGPRIAPVGKAAKSSATETELSYPVAGTHGSFSAQLSYGVIDRGQGVYFLTYWVKAVSRPIQASKVIGKGLEVLAIQKGDAWEVRVVRNGKPCPEADVVWDGDGKEARASAKTAVSIPLPATPKAMPVLASLSIPRGGTYQGKAYASSKEWATIVLPAVGRAPAGADSAAYLALQNASLAREAIAPGAFSFSCDFSATNGEQTATGVVSLVEGKLTIDVHGVDEDYAKHVRSQLMSLFSHRLGGDFWSGEGVNKIQWDNSTGDQSGRRLAVNDVLHSFYRIREGSITQVERTFGPNKLVLDIDSTVTTPWGGTLTKTFTSTETKVADGSVNSRLKYRDDFTPFLDEWMPKSRVVTGTVQGHPIKMTATFSNYRKP